MANSRATLLLLIFVAGLSQRAAESLGQQPDPKQVLAIVNGREIKEGDLAFLYLSRRIPNDQRESLKPRFLEILIEQHLMREFLQSRKATPSQNELDAQVALVLKVIRDAGDEPDEQLSKLGMTRESLREELALPLTWKSYLRLLVTNESLRQYFEKHRPQFDGTQLRVSQIFLNLPKESDPAAETQAEKRLLNLKLQIESGELSFEEAAKLHSESPSKSTGGDTGWITYRGKLPQALCEAAFALKDQELTAPIRSPFGWHVLQVTERKPGELSLEDVRAVVFNQLSQELWQETVKAQKAKAIIEIR